MQVNQSVNAANFLLVSSQAGTSSVTQEETSVGMDFASVLKNTNKSYPYPNNSQVTQSHNTATVIGQEGSSKISKNDQTSQNVQNEQNTAVEKQDGSETKTETKETAGTNETQIKDSKNVDESAQSEQTEVTDEVEEAPIIIAGMDKLSEEDMSMLLEVIGNLVQTVMNQFGLTADELEAKLQEFGMKPEDLLTGEGLKDFFLKMNGADVSELIVNEDLNVELQNFMTMTSEDLNVIETIQTEADFVLSEEDIQALWKQLVSQQKAEGDAPIVVRDDVTSDVVTDEPEVIVVKEAQQDTDSSGSEMNDTNDTNPETKKQQAEQTVKQPVKQETVATDTTSTKQPTFENPILQAIQNAVNNVEATVELEQPVQQTDIIRQVVEQVRVNMNQQATSIEMQLYPEHLGRIQINVVSKEGVMTASIVAETEAAKQAIEAGLLNLKEAMEQQNLKVEAIEVMVSTMGFEQNGEQQQSFDEKGSSNPRRKLDLSELGEDIPVEDEVEIEKMKATGSSVSYRA